MPSRFELGSTLLVGCAAALIACNAISGVDDFEFATGGGGQGGGAGQATSSVASTTATGAGGATTGSVSTGPAPTCSGATLPCNEFTQEGPCDDAGCDWNKASKECSGTPKPCSELVSEGQGTCESVGCVWTP
jgi:hypothetical protein